MAAIDRRLRWMVWLMLVLFLGGVVYVSRGYIDPYRDVTETKVGPASELTQWQCGHWSLVECARMLGVPLSLQTAEEVLPRDPDGHTMLELHDALESFGLSAEGREETFDEFLQGDFPVILHLKSPDHFVVAAQRADNGIVLFDEGARRRVPNAHLRGRWTGYLLRVSRPADPRALLRSPRERPDWSQPRIHLDTLLIDAGDFEYGQTAVDLPYRVTNTGEEPLLISGVDTDCVCVGADYPETPIPAGGSSEIVLHYEIEWKGPRNLFKHHAVVRSNDPQFPEIMLTATGNSSARYWHQPQQLDFGDASWGEVRRRNLFVYHFAPDQSEPVGRIECDFPDTTFRVLPKDEVGQDVRGSTGLAFSGPGVWSPQVIEVTWTSALPVDEITPLEGSLRFVCVADGREISVPVIGTAVPALSVVPPDLILRHGTEQELRGEVVMRARQGARLDEFSVIAPETGVYVTPAGENGRRIRVLAEVRDREFIHQSEVIVSARVSHGDEQHELMIPVRVLAWED